MIIVTGLSGAGKSVALRTFEDAGYYCIDNLPLDMLPALSSREKLIDAPLAVGIDVRSQRPEQQNILEITEQLLQNDADTRVLFLTASPEVLLKRYGESRRTHPLVRQGLSLAEAIEEERTLLAPLMTRAHYKIDTSRLTIYDLKARIENWLAIDSREATTITFESFGFKHGVPNYADLVFDVRFLPNPHWDEALRPFTGQDAVIHRFFESHDAPQAFIEDTSRYLETWLPHYLGSRPYLTVAIGCTGGKHRSVYVTESIAKRLAKTFKRVEIHHRDMPRK